MIKTVAAALALTAAPLLFAAQAHAEDPPFDEDGYMYNEDGYNYQEADVEPDQTSEAICFADSLGYLPEQIAESLRNGDARWNPYRAGEKVWQTIVVDGCE